MERWVNARAPEAAKQLRAAIANRCVCSGLVVEYRTRNQEVAGSTQPSPLQATLRKLLTYCVLRPTQPPTLSGTGNEQQLRLRSEGLVWLTGAMVRLLAAPLVQLSVSAGNGWPHNALQHHWLMPVSCHFRDCKSAAGHKSDSCKLRYNKCYQLS